MKVLVCGGRDYTDVERIYTALEELEEHTGRTVDVLISGGCSGADKCAEQIADRTGIPIMVFPPAWGAFGKSAGPKRNSWMLSLGSPDVVVAAPGGSGTADMVSKAEAAKIPVVFLVENYDWVKLRADLNKT